MSSGSTVGLHIPVGDNAAIRPTLGFGRNSTKYEGSQFINESITSTTWSAGVGAVFYVKSWEATSLYVSPQYSYARGTSSVSDDAQTAHAVSGMLGAQHRFGSRFAVYAEAGLGWSRSKTKMTAGVANSSTTSTSVSSRSTVGGILFF